MGGDMYDSPQARVASRMVNLLSEENKSLRQQLDTYVKKTIKLQQVRIWYIICRHGGEGGLVMLITVLPAVIDTRVRFRTTKISFGCDRITVGRKSCAISIRSIVHQWCLHDLWYF
jgi:hypothetical protein